MKKITLILILILITTLFFGCIEQPDKKDKEIINENNLEKEFFVDVFGDHYFTLNVSWKQGNADFLIIDPNGETITKNSHGRYSNVEWIDDSNNYFFARVYIAGLSNTEGFWKLKAINPTDDFNDFTITKSSVGKINMHFNLEINSLNKNTYKHTEEIYFSASVCSVYCVKDIPITGTAMFYDTYDKKEFNLYDDGLKEHGDQFANDGIYTNIFSDFFGGNGLYQFDFIADNMDGNGVTMVDYITSECPPEMDCQLPQSEPVPRFNRAKSEQIYIEK